MNMWKKVKSILTTPIPGHIWAPILTGALFGTTGVLFMKLPLTSQTDRTLAGSTFGKNESLDLVIKQENGEELRLRVTGVSTMDLVQSLKRTLNSTGRNPLRELY